MFNEQELRIIDVSDYRDAANSILSRTMIRGGQVDVGAMEATAIDHAIHMLRTYKVISRKG